MNWWHAAEAQCQGLNATFAQVFAPPVRWFADLRLANVRFSLLITLGESVVRAVRTRRIRPILGWCKRLVLTVACFPVALWHNRRGVHRGDATTSR
jgi:hypothetical protein